MSKTFQWKSLKESDNLGLITQVSDAGEGDGIVFMLEGVRVL